ncbi:tetratricopeptide repeat protein [Zavarzinella formosa]|uniref:tetratricopeptide repeat protein n=1 Tax=Zavarzinella formosa TaxID=360055 RepID=UPI0002ED1CAF|nr:tetratricopeptide repeat protein [Zavarzinella formosa]
MALSPKKYVPTVGPKLRILLYMVFGGFALLGATGFYLAGLSLLNWSNSPQSYTTPFSLWMFLAHPVIGVVGTLPFLLFGAIHYVNARKRTNRVAVRTGIMLLIAGAVIIATGFALVQLEGLPQLPTGSIPRSVIYWLHVLVPVSCISLYVTHRKAGPRIKWGYAKWWGGGVGTFTVAMIAMHSQDPQTWYREGPKEGAKYFEPSMAKTADGKFISADVLMMDEYCTKCHQDIANDHFHSSHKFSSFNNPAYLFSVRETRKVGLEKDGSVKSSRWCAGCHDPVPFFSGAFDDPKFDDVNHQTAHAGITCTACHAITNVNSTIGNADFTIAEPAHYPFATSKSAPLQWINNQIVKAKPDFHKQTFLKPFHKTAEFCATCHKVSLPSELNHYKEFLRGQNHYDTYLLSGVSGHGVRSFYYPAQAKENCASCHMPLKPSGDFGAKDFDGTGTRKVHNHRFPGGNTGLFELLKFDARYKDHADEFQKTIDMHADYLRGKAEDGSDKKIRIDIFGLKPGATTDTAALIAPLRPQLPKLKPGQSYLIEVVIRTLGVGHPFSQGTVDSNEIWVDFQASSGGKEFARNGALRDGTAGPLDPWSHQINVHMLDRNGNRINRRNPQDIFTPLYDKQIPPGAAAVAHYRIDVPADIKEAVELTARVRYRKFDYEYMKLVHEGKEPPTLPVVDVCVDKMTLPVEGVAENVPAQTSPIKPGWQRWNDYGIGELLEGGVTAKRGHYKQAEEAFKALLALGDKDGTPNAHVNLARVFIEEGRFDEAAAQLKASGECEVPAAWWTRAWFTAVVNGETATSREHLDAAIADLERLLDPDNQPGDRKFDFTKDYVIWARLANRLFKRSQYEQAGSAEQRDYLTKAVKAGERVLALDSEDVETHDLLARSYSRLADGRTGGPTDGLKPMADLAMAATDAKGSRDARLEAATSFAESFPNTKEPALPIVREYRPKFMAAYHAEKDPELKASLAGALASLHRAAHGIFKPDELAQSNATRIYREKNPVANYAARERVIYPTTPAHRDAILKTGNLPPTK